MTWNEALVWGTLACGLLAAAVWDLRLRKIPNWLNLTMTLAGAALALWRGPAELVRAALAWACFLAAGIALWRLRLFRAGDAKLYAAVAALTGGRWAAGCFLWSMLAGGVLGLLLLLRKGALGLRLRRLGSYWKGLVLTRTYAPYDPEPGSEGEFPLALAVAAGAVFNSLFPL